MNRILLAFVLFAMTASTAFSQLGGTGSKFKDIVKSVKATVEPAEAKRGETVTWKLSLELIPGWHTYPTKQPDAEAESFVNKITFPKPGDVVFVDSLQEPPNPIKKAQPDLNIKEMHEYDGKPVWTRKFVVSQDAKPGKLMIKVPVRIQVCDIKNCLPPETRTVEVELVVSDKPAVAVDPKYASQMPKKDEAKPDAKAEPKQPAAVPKAPPAALSADEQEDVPASTDQKAALASIVPFLTDSAKPSNPGLLQFLLQAAFWGAVTLLTPCVFPMIPITVSFFLKQSEKTHVNPLAQALVYCGTIVAVLGTAAFTLLGTFRTVSNHPLTNYLIGGLLVAMALSLFGMFELTLPSSLTRFTAERESRGGTTGTIFMALTFTIVSFTCVAPFLGGFTGLVSSGKYPYWQLALGAYAFAAAFAAPFFLLALFPSLLKKLPKSGGWLNSVKVVMGFLELAAAVKFFRAGELVQTPEPTLFTYDLSLGLWVALSVLCGLYLVNVFRVGHDEPLASVSVPRLFGGIAFVGLSIYLLPAMFVSANGERPRPSGSVYAWVDSFLLPDRLAGSEGMAWTGDLKRAIDETRREAQRSGRDQFVFVDFTGTTCTNCKLNERNIFSRQQVRDLFKPYKLVQLYTDKVPDDLYPAVARAKLDGSTTKQKADAMANLWFQREAFKSESLPLYVILKPTADGRIEVIDSTEGKIDDVTAFEEFLRRPFADSTARASLR